jgi:hypothetical protein
MPVHLETLWNDKNHTQPRLARNTVEVIVFALRTQLIDLLGNRQLFGNLDSLVVNKDTSDSKWKPYERNRNFMYEVLDGEWYQKYARMQVTYTNNQFSCPIGLYIDASETVVYQRYSFQPLIMFPIILNCKACNKITSKSFTIKIATKQGHRLWKGQLCYSIIS